MTTTLEPQRTQECEEDDVLPFEELEKLQVSVHTERSKRYLSAIPSLSLAFLLFICYSQEMGVAQQDIAKVKSAGIHTLGGMLMVCPRKHKFNYKEKNVLSWFIVALLAVMSLRSVSM